jgi:hypothetical protein
MIKIPKSNKVAKSNKVTNASSKYPYVDGVLLAIVVYPQFKVRSVISSESDQVLHCANLLRSTAGEMPEGVNLDVVLPVLPPDVISPDSEVQPEVLSSCAILTSECSSEFFYKALKNHIKVSMGLECEAGLAGHEHSPLTGKCHFQCAVKLTKRVQRTFKPFVFELGSFDMTGQYQAGKSWDALLQYCVKDDDFYAENCSPKAVDVYRAIAESHNITPEEAMRMLAKGDPKALLMNGDKIFKNFTQFIWKEPEKPFEWVFPPHLFEIINNGVAPDASDIDVNFVARLQRIYEWYLEFCVSDKWQGKRKKALCLYSKDRGLGKTVFATSLVSDQPERFIYCRNALDGRMFANKEKVAKLILIDDVQYFENQLEIWKALVASSPVIFNTKYCQQSWKEYLPVIITTNSKAMLEMFVNDDRFNTQVLSIEIEKYMGKPKTKPEFLKREVMISAQTEDDIAFIKQKRERSGPNFNS